MYGIFRQAGGVKHPVLYRDKPASFGTRQEAVEAIEELEGKSNVYVANETWTVEEI